jgi:hypothetical protein
MTPDTQREAQRQRLLLAALWRDLPSDVLDAWLGSPGEATVTQGLAAYRANAGAIAERALAGAFPTVAALVGAESFAGLARALWQQHPPARGDLGEWGAELPDFIAASGSLASEPYLADSARLDWLVHRASRAADGPALAPALDALGQLPPEGLRLTLRPGCALLSSAWPVAAIWQAHQRQDDERFSAVRAAFDAGHGQHAWVRRDGFAVEVDTIDAVSARFNAALLSGVSLAAALDAASDRFAFDQWLVQALRQRWLVDIQPLPTATPP